METDAMNQFWTRVILHVSTFLPDHCVKSAGPRMTTSLLLLILLNFSISAHAWDQPWSDLTINLLSDSAFAAVENAETTDKIRRCPHHDANGDLDLEQLIYVLGAFEEEAWLDLQVKAQAKKHLLFHYQQAVLKSYGNELSNPIDINAAALSELIRLPNIGPVLAVKIYHYRIDHQHFDAIEEIQNVDGIGKGTFNAIRHYIVAR